MTKEFFMTLSGTFLKGATGALGLAVALAIACPAHAQATSSAKPSLFQRLDANHDGKVTLDEYKAYRDAIWKKYDAKGTGTVSKKTYVHGSKERTAAFARLDANGDGVLQKSEFDAETQQLFDKRDHGQKGYLTATDFGSRSAKSTKKKSAATHG
jgi:Ca2+-binding EF-hand superfamily protein